MRRAHALLNQADFRVKFRLKNSQGGYPWLTCSSRPLKDIEETFSGYMGSCSDIMECKQIETIKLEAMEKIHLSEKSLATLGMLTAEVAHEVNQRLNVIKEQTDGILYLDKEGKVLEKDALLQGIKNISEQADRIALIIKQLQSCLKGDRLVELHKCNSSQVVVLPRRNKEWD